MEEDSSEHLQCIFFFLQPRYNIRKHLLETLHRSLLACLLQQEKIHDIIINILQKYQNQQHFTSRPAGASYLT